MFEGDLLATVNRRTVRYCPYSRADFVVKTMNYFSEQSVLDLQSCRYCFYAGGICSFLILFGLPSRICVEPDRIVIES